MKSTVQVYGPAAVIGYAVLSVGMYIPIFWALRRWDLLSGTAVGDLAPGAAALVINRLLRPIRVGILIVVLPRLSKRWSSRPKP